MKKFIIMFAAIAAATVASASAVNWQVTNIFEPNASTKAAGYIAYLFDASTVSDKAAVEASIKGNTFGTYASQSVNNATSANGTIIKANAVSGLSAGTYSYYTVLFDAGSYGAAKNYIVSDTKSVTLGAAGSSSALFASITGATSGTNWQSVPEPTSAMLLLLGVAGLALKRKQK